MTTPSKSVQPLFDKVWTGTQSHWEQKCPLGGRQTVDDLTVGDILDLNY